MHISRGSTFSLRVPCWQGQKCATKENNYKYINIYCSVVYLFVSAISYTFSFLNGFYFKLKEMKQQINYYSLTK